MSRRALGKGIDALFQDEGEPLEGGEVQTLPLDRIKPNPAQPRRAFPAESLAELADSIREKGVIQPIIVEPEPRGETSGEIGPAKPEGAEQTYTVVAGERRYRAARLAGLESIPALVRRFRPAEKLEIALIENIQREDLTPVEEALSYKRLGEVADLSQEEIARRVGKNRSTVANSLRLLKLPEDMLDALDRGEISAGHARAVLSVEGPAGRRALFEGIREEGLSVRQAEQRAADLNRGRKEPAKKGAAARRRQDPELSELEQRLIERTGTKVALQGTMSRGRIVISYYSKDDLERLLELFEG